MRSLQEDSFSRARTSTLSHTQSDAEKRKRCEGTRWYIGQSCDTSLPDAFYLLDVCVLGCSDLQVTPEVTRSLESMDRWQNSLTLTMSSCLTNRPTVSSSEIQLIAGNAHVSCEAILLEWICEVLTCADSNRIRESVSFTKQCLLLKISSDLAARSCTEGSHESQKQLSFNQKNRMCKV